MGNETSTQNKNKKNYTYKVKDEWLPTYERGCISPGILKLIPNRRNSKFDLGNRQYKKSLIKVGALHAIWCALALTLLFAALSRRYCIMPRCRRRRYLKWELRLCTCVCATALFLALCLQLILHSAAQYSIANSVKINIEKVDSIKEFLDNDVKKELKELDKKLTANYNNYYNWEIEYIYLSAIRRIIHNESQLLEYPHGNYTIRTPLTRLLANLEYWYFATFLAIWCWGLFYTVTNGTLQLLRASTTCGIIWIFIGAFATTIVAVALADLNLDPEQSMTLLSIENMNADDEKRGINDEYHRVLCDIWFEDFKRRRQIYRQQYNRAENEMTMKYNSRYKKHSKDYNDSRAAVRRLLDVEYKDLPKLLNLTYPYCAKDSPPPKLLRTIIGHIHVFNESEIEDYDMIDQFLRKKQSEKNKWKTVAIGAIVAKDNLYQLVMWQLIFMLIAAALVIIILIVAILRMTTRRRCAWLQQGTKKCPDYDEYEDDKCCKPSCFQTSCSQEKSNPCGTSQWRPGCGITLNCPASNQCPANMPCPAQSRCTAFTNLSNVKANRCFMNRFFCYPTPTCPARKRCPARLKCPAESRCPLYAVSRPFFCTPIKFPIPRPFKRHCNSFLPPCCPAKERCPRKIPCPGNDYCPAKMTCPAKNRCPILLPCPAKRRCPNTNRFSCISPCPAKSRCPATFICPARNRCPLKLVCPAKTQCTACLPCPAKYRCPVSNRCLGVKCCPAKTRCPARLTCPAKDRCPITILCPAGNRCPTMIACPAYNQCPLRLPCPAKRRCPNINRYLPRKPCPAKHRCPASFSCPAQTRCPSTFTCPARECCPVLIPCPAKSKCLIAMPCPAKNRCPVSNCSVPFSPSFNRFSFNFNCPERDRCPFLIPCPAKDRCTVTQICPAKNLCPAANTCPALEQCPLRLPCPAAYRCPNRNRFLPAKRCPAIGRCPATFTCPAKDCCPIKLVCPRRDRCPILIPCPAGNQCPVRFSCPAESLCPISKCFLNRLPRPYTIPNCSPNIFCPANQACSTTDFYSNSGPFFNTTPFDNIFRSASVSCFTSRSSVKMLPLTSTNSVVQNKVSSCMDLVPVCKKPVSALLAPVPCVTIPECSPTTRRLPLSSEKSQFSKPSCDSDSKDTPANKPENTKLMKNPPNLEVNVPIILKKNDDGRYFYAFDKEPKMNVYKLPPRNAKTAKTDP